MYSTQNPGEYDEKLFKKIQEVVVYRTTDEEVFLYRWVAEYLPKLTRRTKWYRKVNLFKVDNFVLICDEIL